MPKFRVKGIFRGSKTHPNESSNKAGDGSIEGTMKKFKLEKFTAGETFGADEALMKKVLKKLKQKDKKKQKHHIIVFCPITSRVGSDVVAALDNVKEDQSVILVLMHHTRDSDYSTARMSWSETTTNVDLDVHVLFHETLPGLLTCSQNDKAVGQIVDFLKQKKKTEQKKKGRFTKYFRSKSKQKDREPDQVKN